MANQKEQILITQEIVDEVFENVQSFSQPLDLQRIFREVENSGRVGSIGSKIITSESNHETRIRQCVAAILYTLREERGTEENRYSANEVDRAFRQSIMDQG